MPDPSGSYGGDLSGTQTYSNYNGSGSQPSANVGPTSGNGSNYSSGSGYSYSSPNSSSSNGGNYRSGGGNNFSYSGAPTGYSSNAPQTVSSRSNYGPSGGLGSNASPEASFISNPAPGFASALHAGLGIAPPQQQQAPQATTFSLDPSIGMLRDHRANVYLSSVPAIPQPTPLNAGLPAPSAPVLQNQNMLRPRGTVAQCRTRHTRVLDGIGHRRCGPAAGHKPRP